jgi:hypothetical protein
MKANLEAFNHAADYYHENIPGVVAIINSVDKLNPNMVHDLQIFRDMEAFNKHADMAEFTLKDLLMDWSQHWEEGGVTGHVFCDFPRSVQMLTDGFGAKFEFHPWPASSGMVNMKSGEKW